MGNIEREPTLTEHECDRRIASHLGAQYDELERKHVAELASLRRQLEGAVSEIERLRTEIERLKGEWRKADDGWIAARQQLQGAVLEIERLRAGISWARGLCTDEAPYAEIDAGLGRALDHPGGAVDR